MNLWVKIANKSISYIILNIQDTLGLDYSSIFFFAEVRSAAVDSLCTLALRSPDFSNLALDFLVDMFNDEIEEVRIKAIDSLTKISKHIVLWQDQLEIVLAVLEVRLFACFCNPD